MTDLIAVVQARTSSTRLPGKVLKEVAGETVLGRVVRAVTAAGAVDEVVVATSTDPSDDAVVEECARLGVPAVRGPLDDVLRRYVIAVEAHPADAVMRITADCPLLDPEVVRVAAGAWRGVGDLDYLSTALVRTLPRGLDVEVVSLAALRTADERADGHDRVHVTSYVYSNPAGFRLLGLTFQPAGGHVRATLDTPEDWAFVEAVVGHFGHRQPPVAELVTWLDAHPEVVALNADVRQKDLAEG